MEEENINTNEWNSEIKRLQGEGKTVMIVAIENTISGVDRSSRQNQNKLF